MSAAAEAVRLTVLYIEDNASNLLLVKRILRDRHHLALRTASRGEEGLEMARTDPPGLILLDLHLPDMAGTEVLEALRADPLTAEIPVVVVSADATRDQVEHLRGRGVADYVTKPFEVPRLMAVIDSFAQAPGESAPPEVAARSEADGVLDFKRVAEFFELDADGSTFRSIAAVALDEADNQIDTITAAADGRGDVSAVIAAAHGLKSSATIIGARRLAGLADAVEMAARAGSLPGASMVSELRGALTATKQATIDVNGRR
jgi:CheY-like chemotaxis protein